MEEQPSISPKHRQVLAEILMPFLILGIGVFIYDCNHSRTGRHQSIQGSYEETRLVNAIYYAEGGSKTRFPYGIKSSVCSSKAQCKDECIKRIRHYWKDFKQTKEEGIENFTRYASQRYVGSDDPQGQINWYKNVLWYYRKVK